MSLEKKFSVKLVWVLAVACILTMSMTTSLHAQIKDTAVVSMTEAIDNTLDKEVILSDRSSLDPLISTAVDTGAYAQYRIQPEGNKFPVYQFVAYYFMLFFLICACFAIVAKVLSLYELTRELQEEKKAINWRNLQATLFVLALIFGLYGVYWSFSVHGPMSMDESGSVHGEHIDMMFKITLLITSVVFILTHIVLFGFVYKYRGVENRKAHFYPDNSLLERVWTIIPALTLTVLVIFGFFTWRSVTNISEEDQRKALNIEVVGEQFKWSIRYAGQDNVIGSRSYKLISTTNNLGINFKDEKNWDDQLAGEIVIPINRPVRVTIGSKDVLHSFYIPTLRVQMNAVPGMPTYFQFTPRYTTAEMRERRNDPIFDYILLCAKICGSGHYNMQTKVSVVSESEYQAWLLKQPLYYNDEVKKEMSLMLGSVN